MIRKITISVLMALVVGSSLAVVSARTEGRNCSTVTAIQARSRRLGPYATIRRANEVANYYRSRGYNAKVIYGGTLDSRVYYVDVW
jgi:hypothetical protein